MNVSRLMKVAGLVAIPVFAAALPTAIGQPPADAGKQPPPPKERPGRGGDGDRRPEGDNEGGGKWRQEYKEELREHPRLARAIVALHEVKEHLEKAPHDFGGHKVAAIKAVDDAIKELKEAIKFDAKHEGGDKGKDGDKGEKGERGRPERGPKGKGGEKPSGN